MSVNAGKYVVINENTLAYSQEPASRLFGVLEGSVIRGGHNPLNGPISISHRDVVREATVADFVAFKVSPVGHLQ